MKTAIEFIASRKVPSTVQGPELEALREGTRLPREMFTDGEDLKVAEQGTVPQPPG